MRSSWKWASITASCVATAAVAVVATRAWADGIPSTGALSYSGLLLGSDGEPQTGAKTIEVRLWSTQVGGASALCTSGATTLTLDGGRFSVLLPDTCTDAVADNADSFVEVLVGGSSLGRTKLGAVPYAVEAKHAVTADTAAVANEAGGALRTTIDNLSSGSSAIVTGWTRDETFTLTTSAGAEVANQTTFANYRRIGDSIDLEIITQFSAAPGVGTASLGYDLPANMAHDQNKTNSFGSAGFGLVYYSGTNAMPCAAFITGPTRRRVGLHCGTSGGLTGTSPSAPGTASRISVRLSYPVQGWTLSD